MDYRGIAWIRTSYHRIRDCLEMLLNIMEYRGLAHHITASGTVLEMVLNIIEYRGLSSIIMDYRGISWNSME